MATIKFREPSPYQQSRPQLPEDDYLLARYVEQVSLDPTKRGNKRDPEPINVALFGCGRAGSIHLSNLATNRRARILYIVDDVESKWESMKSFWQLDNTTRFLASKDSKIVFDDPRVHAVIVSSPTHTHEAIVTSALNKGKAVFCEKPIAGDIESTRRCYDLAKKVGKPLLCAFNRRFDTSYSQVRRLVREGKVGHVHMVKTCSRDSPLPSIEYLKTSGRIFHDCAVHDIDLVCWILGELPCRASAVANANIPEIKAMGDFDTVAIVLNFPSGTIAMIDLSRRSCYGYDQRVEVFGPRGMLSCQNERPCPGIESHYGLEGGNTTNIWHSYPSRFRQGYINELEHFFDAVEGKAKISVDSRQTLAVSKIASALDESAVSGKQVELSWTKEELLPED